MKKLLLATLLLILSTDGASALTCSTYRSSSSYSQWRLIDGRKCWYKGKHRIDKAQLHWIKLKPRPRSHRFRPAKIRPLVHYPIPDPIPSAEEQTINKLCGLYGLKGRYLGDDAGECHPP